MAKRSVTNKAHDGPMIKQSELKKLLPYSRAKELCAAHGFSFSTMTDILYMKIINPSAFIASEICSHIGIDMRRVKWGE